jgi:phosphoglycolate phosphatase-like HAD superfamily hydrolase
MSADWDMPEGQSDVFAFDFDGVICDSVGENFITTWHALRALEPDLPATPPAQLRDQFISCRPAIETGYQNIPLMQLLLTGVTVSDMLENFDTLVRNYLDANGLTDADMMNGFGVARAAWRDADPQGWFDAQGFYEHTFASVNAVADRAIIATTKQNAFACRLVERAGLQVPLPRVYGLERLGPRKKRTVLEELERRNPHAVVHFFEDRIATLEKLTDLPRTKLHLVDWGYNLEQHRERARASEHMDLLSPESFAALIQGR